MKNTAILNKIITVFVLTFLMTRQDAEAQSHDPGRGMYVDAFALAADAEHLIPGYSILGNSAKEDSLFLFARENHITYLALYNLNEIFNGDTIKTVLDTLLCDFIRRAKQNGIKKIGAVISSPDRLDVLTNFNERLFNPNKAWTFTNAEKSTSAYSRLQFVENSYSDTSALFEIAYMTRLMLQVAHFNKAIINVCDSTAKFDVLSFEDEFWNPGNKNNTDTSFSMLFNKSKILMDKMASVRAMNNATSNTKLSTEIYLGIIDSLRGLPQDTIIKYLDRSFLTTGQATPDGKPLFNRVLATYYHANPNSSYNRSDYHSRFIAYQSTTTNDTSRVFPLFSSGSIALGYSEDLFGRWFSRSPRFNHFAAERIWHDSALVDPARLTNIHGNLIERGGDMWYTYTSLGQNPMNAAKLKHTKTFYSNSPLFLNGATRDTARFNYIGPLESGIVYDLKVDSLNGTNLYTKHDTIRDSNSSFSLPDLGKRTLWAGTYHASLKLNYGNGISYTYKEKFVVSGSRLLEVVGDTPMCENNSVTLWASRINTTSTVRYAWYKDSLTNPNPVYTYNDTNYYEVKVPGHYYCKIRIGTAASIATSNDIVIRTSANAIPTFTVGKLSGPSCAFIIASGTQQAGTTYLWSNGDTGRVAEVHYSDTYKVTVTQANGCHRSGKYKVTLSNFGCQNKGDTLVSLTPTQIPNHRITGHAVVRENWDISSNLVFDDATIDVRPGKKITIRNGGVLSLENGSIVQSCGDTLWAGIEVKKGGTLNSFSGSAINDARHGVELRDSSNYQIEHTTFDNNYIGIYLTGYYHLINGHFYNSGSVKNCLFQSSTLQKKYSGMSETLGSKGLAGIQVENGKMFINLNNPNDKTIFKNLSNGIISQDNSYMVNHYSLFKNIHADAAYNSLVVGNGSGVNVQDNDPIYAQRVASNRQNKNFIDCDYGVYSRNSSVDVRQTVMDSVMRGVYITALNPLKTHRALVTLNDINARNKGVSVTDADLSHATVVLGNKIKIGYFPSTGNETGIEINHTLSVASHDTALKITNNQIFCSNAAYAIHGQHAVSATINGNFIQFDNNTTKKRTGIDLDNCTRSLIENNVIKGDFDTTRTDQLLTGFSSSLSDSIIVTCNQVDSTAIGFKFSSQNSATEFRANGTNSNNFGVFLDSSGSIGTQTHNGNLYSKNYKTKAAINWGQVIASKFITDTNAIYYPSAKIYPPNNWFIPDPDTNEYQCELTSIYIPYNLNNTGGTIWIGGTPVSADDYQYMRVIANDSLQPNEFPDEAQEIASDELYERLLKHPELLADPELNSFYLLESQSASGQMTKLRLLQESYDPEIVQARNNLSSAEYYLTQVAIALEQNAAEIESSGETEALLIERESLIIQYDVLNALYAEKLETYSSLFGEFLEKILEENAQVEVASLMQENEQIVNTIAYETVLEDNFEFNDAQRILLESVIHQCPKAGGKAVYRARALYALISDTIEYNDEANCASQGFYRIKNDSKKDKTENSSLVFKVKPNPANTSFSVSPISEPACLKVFNSQGLLVYQSDLGNEYALINTSTLSNGIYYISISTVKETIVKKLSIIH